MAIMRSRGGARHGVQPRGLVVALVLASHIFGTFGFPLIAPTGGKAQDASQPYPCQSRPCGCSSAEKCWEGDCRCFTLAQKLAWADANGVEPPEHVRPLVESSGAGSAPKSE